MAEVSETAVAPPPPAASPQRKNSSGFKDRADYLAWLNEQKSRRGEKWYAAKIVAMTARDNAMKAEIELRNTIARREKDASWALWRERISAWSVGGGFDVVVAKLLGEGKKVSSGRRQFNVGGVKIEIDVRKHTIARFDGNNFQNGKKGSREAMGVAKCIFELGGSSDPGKDARALVAEVSGIQPEQVILTADVEKRLSDMQAAAAAAAAKRAAEEEREDPLTAEKLEELPNRITDTAEIERLTEIMARERSFPLDYAKRTVSEGAIWFGTYRYRNQDTQRLVDTGRPIVCSDVRGFETGQLVGCGGRELKAFYSKEEGKGKNSGFPSKGAVFIGNWSESTKRITTTEGVYDGLALRLMRERQGKPLADDECILAMTGQRLPERLVKLCAKRGISITAAVDNDLSGRELVESAMAACEASGVPFRAHLPSRAEVTFKMSDDAWGREAYLDVARKLSEMEARFCFLPSEAGALRLVAETSDQTCALVKQTRINEQTSRPARSANAEVSPRFGVKWHRKDWNELIQCEYAPRAATTAGLPSAEAALEDELNRYLAAKGATPASSEALRKHLLVYPAVVEGKQVAIWTAVDPATGAVLGFRAEPLQGGQSVAAGATWRVGFGLGDTKKSSVMVVADSPEGAIHSWQTGGRESFTILRLDGKFPQSALEAAKQASMAVSPSFESTGDALERQAKLAQWARKNGLAYRAPAMASVAPAPAPIEGALRPAPLVEI